MRIILPVLSILGAGGGGGSRWPPESYEEFKEPGPGDIYPCLAVVLVSSSLVMNSFIYSFNKDDCICSVPGSGLHTGDRVVASFLREQMSVVDTLSGQLNIHSQPRFLIPNRILILFRWPSSSWVPLCASAEMDASPRVNHDCNAPELVVRMPSCVVGLGMGT